MKSPLPLEIRGTGPVANALALWLVREGLPAADIRLTDSQGRGRSVDSGFQQPPDWLGQRALAMSLGSLQLLARICAPPEQAPIESVEISMLGNSGRTHIEAPEHGKDRVGAVVRYGSLVQTLHAAVQQHQWYAPPEAPGFGPMPDTSIVVHAEGRIESTQNHRTFNQSALLADIRCVGGSIQHGQAFERFTLDGPLAMLPVVGTQLWTLVWCASDEKTARRLSEGPNVWLAELSKALGSRFGRLELASEPSSSTLTRNLRERHVQAGPAGPCEIWIGNAAQSLHPVAGQGLNLGFRDAFELAQILGLWHSTPANTGQRLLEQFSRQRRRDQRDLVGITDTLATIFTYPVLRPLQSGVLHGMNLFPAVKSFIAQELMFGRRTGA